MSYKQFLHLKSGGKYILIGKGKLEWNLQPVVIYKSTKTNDLWVRPEKEFFDGRFKFEKTVDLDGNLPIPNWEGLY